MPGAAFSDDGDKTEVTIFAKKKQFSIHSSVIPPAAFSHIASQSLLYFSGICLTSSGKWYLEDFNPTPTASPEPCNASCCWHMILLPGSPRYALLSLQPVDKKDEHSLSPGQAHLEPTEAGLVRRCILWLLKAGQKNPLRQSFQALARL